MTTWCWLGGWGVLAAQGHVVGYYTILLVILFGMTISTFEVFAIFHHTRYWPHAQQDPKPISPKGEANPVHAAQLVDGEKVLIKSFPGGDWKQRSLFTLLATHNNIAKYKGHTDSDNKIIDNNVLIMF